MAIWKDKFIIAFKFTDSIDIIVIVSTNKVRALSSNVTQLGDRKFGSEI
jgi:hypothetical protein